MATPTEQQLRNYNSASASLSAESVLERILTALSIQTSGFNPDGTAYTQPVSGSLTVSGGQTPGDGVANPTDASDVRAFLEGWNGATWDRLKSTSGALNVLSPTPTAANILDGFLSVTATTAATTLITIPSGRTWIGYITINCACQSAAASTTAPNAVGIVSTAGASVTPAAGNYLECDATNGAGAVGGAVGVGAANSVTSRFVVVAPGGNSVTIQGASTNAGTASKVTFFCIGELQ